jgi:3-deoxy-7-phosphoheptulonate synthase
MTQWSKESWRNFKVDQDVEYPDKNELQKVLGKLERLPPLVSAGEVDFNQHRWIN